MGPTRTRSSPNYLGLLHNSVSLQYLAAVASVTLAIALVLLISSIMIIPNAGTIYLLVVVAAALWLGTGPAALAALLALCGIAYFYVPLDANAAVSTVRLVVIAAALAGGVYVARRARQEGARALAFSQEARQQAEYLTAVIDCTPDPVYVANAQGRLVTVNKAGVELLGLKSKEEVLRPLAEYPALGTYLLPDGRVMPLDEYGLAKALRGETFTGYEFGIQIGDGTIRWASISGAPVRNEHGKITAAVNVTRDVTAQKQAEEERERLANQLRLLLQSVDEGVYGADIEGSCTFFNRSAARMLGYEPEEIVGKPIHSIIHNRHEDGSVYPVEQCPMFRALRSGEGARIEGEVLWRRNGSSFPVELSSHPIIDAGVVVGAVVTFVDTTERKRAAEERERLLAVAEAERARLAAVLQQMPSGVIIAEAPSGMLIMGNEQVERIWRQPFLASARIGEYGEWKGFHADGRPYQSGEWPMARSVSSGEVVNDEEIHILRGDGTRGTISVGSAPIRDAEGRVVAGVVVFHDITERKKAQQEHETVLRTAQDGFWIVDMQGRLLDVNESYCRMSGYTREELLGMRIADVEAAETAEEIARHIRRVMERGFDRFETRHRRKDGGLVDFEISVTYLAGDQGRMFAFLRDITSRKQAEQALKESEQRFRSVFASNVVSLAIWDAQGHLLDANDRFLEIIGYTRQEFGAGQVRWDECTPPELRQRDYDAVIELQAGREIIPYEKEFIRRDGTRIPVLIGGAMLQGMPDTGIAFALDITERKRAEAQRERLLSEVSAQRELFQTVVENAPAGIAVIGGPHMAYELVNPTYQAIAPGKRILGRSWSEVWAEVAAEVQPLVDAVMQSGQPYRVVDAPYRIRRTPDGPPEEAYFTFSYLRIRDPEGGNALLVAALETTEQVRARMRVEQLAERLRLSQQVARVGTFDWNIQTGVNRWTPELEVMYGLQPGGFAGTQPAWEALVYPEDRTKAVGAVERTLRTGSPEEGEWRVIWPDGSVHWLAGRFQAFKDESGRPLV